jgi:hypothetical protein
VASWEVMFITWEERRQTVFQESIFMIIFDRKDVTFQRLIEISFDYEFIITSYTRVFYLNINSAEYTATLQCPFIWTRVNHVSNNATTCQQPIFSLKRKRFIEGRFKSEGKYIIVAFRNPASFKPSQCNVPLRRRCKSTEVIQIKDSPSYILFNVTELTKALYAISRHLIYSY